MVYTVYKTSLLLFEVSAKSSWWEEKRQLNVSAKHWSKSTEILLIPHYNSFQWCLYLPVSSASGYMPFQFGQLIRRTGEWRQLNFSSWRGAAQSYLPCLKVRSYGTLLLRYLLMFFSFRGRIGQKKLSHPDIQVNNRLVLHKNDKMWAQTSISQQTAFTFTPAGGQLASSFIISWYSPRLPLLQEVENVLQLIDSPGTESHLDIGLHVLFHFQPSPSFKVIIVITHCESYWGFF